MPQFPEGSVSTALVGVICSPTDLKRAHAMRRPPDLFEVRLDALAPNIQKARGGISKLTTPIIMTARDPAEGGYNRLRLRERRALLHEFLPNAAYLDVELRSAEKLSDLIREARDRSIGLIVSVHHLHRSPSLKRLGEIVRAARQWKADFLKIASRTDNPHQLAILRDFLMHYRGSRVAVMGIGKLGLSSRLEFVTSGSALAYGHLGKARIAGQPSLAKLRRILKKEGLHVG
jgi:3-dehydroquinate dehydratase I